MAREKLDAAAAREAVRDLEGWTLDGDAVSIGKRFEFRNFSQAFGFMTRCALAAERLDHHPEWSNVFKTVDVRLTTHDASGLTELDFKLAKLMNRYAGG